MEGFRFESIPGACLYELLTGQKAFPDGPVAPRPTASLHALRPDVPEAVATVIERMLAGNRDERFADAGTCRAELLWAASPAIPAGPAERLEWYARAVALVAEPTRTLPVLGPHGATVPPPSAPRFVPSAESPAAAPPPPPRIPAVAALAAAPAQEAPPQGLAGPGSSGLPVGGAGAERGARRKRRE